MLLQLHLHSRPRTWLQWIGRRQLQDDTRIIYVLIIGVSYIRAFTVVKGVPTKSQMGVQESRLVRRNYGIPEINAAGNCYRKYHDYVMVQQDKQCRCSLLLMVITRLFIIFTILIDVYISLSLFYFQLLNWIDFMISLLCASVSHIPVLTLWSHSYGS